MKKQFYNSEEEFIEFYRSLKLIQCPCCRKTGFLILHGYLYGYNETAASEIIKRGRRIFCSNRKNSKGCGKTFSLLLTHFIKGFIIQASSIWEFLKNISAGKSKKASFEKLNLSFSNSAIYRLYDKFKSKQTHIRTLLSNILEPPHLKDTGNPEIQTINHLINAFKDVSCPVESFQNHFQISFL